LYRFADHAFSSPEGERNQDLLLELPAPLCPDAAQTTAGTLCTDSMHAESNRWLIAIGAVGGRDYTTRFDRRAATNATRPRPRSW